MSRIKVTITHTQTATLDIGDLPVNMISDLLTKNDGTFDGNWSIGDASNGSEEWVVNAIEVEEVK